MLRRSFAIALAMLVSTPATAAVVITGGTTGTVFTVNFDGNVATTPVAGLTSQIVFKFEQLLNGGKTYKFSYTLNNTSSSPITASRVSGFAFNTTPNIASASATGLFTNTHIPAALPNGVGAVELCVNGGNTCQGGANGGVSKGLSGTGTFSLNFTTAQSQIQFDQFFVRYQSIAGTRLGDSGTGTGTLYVPPAVPEPTTWMMFLFGFAAIGSAIRHGRLRQLATV